MTKKVFIIGNSYYHQVSEMFELEGWDVIGDANVSDLLVLTGGADIDPAIYGHKNRHSHCDSYRDQQELRVMDSYFGKKPVAGICRGAQLLCALNGGTLWQDVDNHAIGGRHKVICNDGEIVNVTSLHHQMMRPVGGLIIGVSEPLCTERHGDGPSDFGLCEDDPEIVYWKSTNTYAFQGHPEFVRHGDECRNRWFKDINKYILGE